MRLRRRRKAYYTNNLMHIDLTRRLPSLQDSLTPEQPAELTLGFLGKLIGAIVLAAIFLYNAFLLFGFE